MDRVAEAHQKWMSVLAFERTKSLYDFSTHFVKAYEAKKQRSSNLDFDDLIGKARALLSDKDVAQWVLFRLDGGIDHVLTMGRNRGSNKGICDWRRRASGS